MLKQVVIAFDQLLNALLGGMADETLSSRAWRARRHKYWWWTHRVINGLFFWQANHCRAAFEAEIKRRHLPRDMG